MPTCAAILNDGALPPEDAVRIEEMINYFDYGYALPDRPDAAVRADRRARIHRRGRTGKTLLHIGIKGYDIRPRERPPLNLVFLIDTSGSMDEANKLPLVKKAMRMLVDELTREGSRLDRRLCGLGRRGAGADSRVRKRQNPRRARPSVAGGSTAGGEGIALAYSWRSGISSRTAVNRVILATDGDFNVGITDPKQLEDFVVAQARRAASTSPSSASATATTTT